MKQDSIAIGKKSMFDLKAAAASLPVRDIVVTIGATCAIAIGLFLFWNHPISRFLQVLVFFVGGWFYLARIRKEMQTITAGSEMIALLAGAGLIFVLLTSLYFWNVAWPFFDIFACVCAFLLPFTIAEVWKAHFMLSLDHAIVWHPTTEPEKNYPSFYFNSTRMRVHVLGVNGESPVTLPFKLSNELALGKIYYDLVQNKSKKLGKDVALYDGSRRPYKWIFFTVDGFVLTRPLDPAKTLAENGLSKYHVIYAQRVLPGDIEALNRRQNEFY